MEKLTKRQQELLYKITEYYIKNAVPVGSKQISEDLGLSSATIRNEMAELEKLGYLAQPHISAGRIPTQNAYKFYVETFLQNVKDRDFDWSLLEEYEIDFANRDSLKDLSKKLADKLELSIIIAFSKSDVFYTGMSKLFSQPEFRKDFVYISDFSNLFDQIDEKIEHIFEKVIEINEPIILIGNDNPFSKFCGSVMCGIDNKIICIIGPMRMDYKKAITYINILRKINNNNQTDGQRAKAKRSQKK